MSTNKYSNHLLVLPEDEANQEIANGFVLHPQVNQRLIQVLPHSRGWTVLVDTFIDDHVSKNASVSNKALFTVD